MADTILVPLELPDPEPLSPLLIEDLSSLDVVVLGHYDLPEQTPASSAREQFGEAAQATLDEVAASFADAGASVRTRLVFGKDRAAAIRQVAVEEDCAAEPDPAPTEGVERILVPPPDVAESDR
ncbi:universal stress protein UspA, partial [Halorubrum sp. E3]